MCILDINYEFFHGKEDYRDKSFCATEILTEGALMLVSNCFT